ncbi:MAG: DUF1648 domain-containing protein [Planctomycetota bacterium]
MVISNTKRQSTTDRPVPRIPRSRINVVLDVVAFAGVVVCVVIVVGSWGALPEAIPQHFGLWGRSDAWCGRWILVFLCVVAAMMYVLMSVVHRFPYQFRPAGWVTERNKARQYRIAISLAAWLKAEFVWMITLSVWNIVRVALGKAEGLGVLFTTGWFAVLGTTVAVHLVVSYRSR